jgi:hypothetical protein
MVSVRKGAAVRQGVERHVLRPALAASARCRQRDSLAARLPLAPAAAHLQVRLPVEAIHALVMARHPVTRDETCNRR